MKSFFLFTGLISCEKPRLDNYGLRQRCNGFELVYCVAQNFLIFRKVFLTGVGYCDTVIYFLK